MTAADQSRWGTAGGAAARVHTSPTFGAPPTAADQSRWGAAGGAAVAPPAH
jgi:hypothetical protein